MNDNRLDPLPQATGRDHLHTGVKLALSLIPQVGGPASELFAVAIAPPLSRRRDAWLQVLGDAISRLQEKVEGIENERLADRDEFVTVALQASQIALRNHQLEKIEALRNAVLNVALGRSPDEDLQAIFLDHVDTLTCLHIRILKFFRAPAECAAFRGADVEKVFEGSLEPLFHLCFPEHDNRDFRNLILRDLQTRGFFWCSGIENLMIPPYGLHGKVTSDLGDRFLEFIETPREIG